MSTSPAFVYPERLGIDADRLLRAFDLLDEMTRSGEVPAAAVCLGRGPGLIEPRFFGRQGPEADAPPIRPDSRFLVASLTKPVTATAVMILVERGLLTLDDPVARIIPEFGQNEKWGVRVRHLLTHTSGLVDMLPEDEQLRAEHAPLEAFVEAGTRQPLLFPSGTKVRYQSLGFAMLGEIVRRLSGSTLPDFLRAEVFEPLGMVDTSLGRDESRRDRHAWIKLNPEQAATDWNWNTPYWLGLGAPWGGLVSTPADYGRFLQLFLNGGRTGEDRLLGCATVQAMTRNQLAGMPEIPEEDRRCRPWGLGWRLSWPGTSAHFGDLLGPRTFGHWGATGTLGWADPDRDAFAVCLTTQPAGLEGRHLSRVSNVLASALG